MIHIGISGPISAGKSTLAQSLRQIAIESGYACEIVSFAAGIREIISLEQLRNRERHIAALLFNWGYDLTQSDTIAGLISGAMYKYPSETGKKNRPLLQTIGTEIGRSQLGEDCWITRTQQILRGKILDFAISDDVRFNNEAMAVDVHIRIDVELSYEGYREWNKRIATRRDEFSHVSEHSLGLSPLFKVPANFTQHDVLHLFEKLDRIRKLRY